MDDVERRSIDKHEATGLLSALRQRVKAYCAPLWWEVGGQTILANASMSIVATNRALFGVTNDHVLKIYEGHKTENPDVFCQLGNAPFDPTGNLIARSALWDLATFRIPAETLKYCGHEAIVAATWPPTPIKKGDSVILGGYPEARRSMGPGTLPSTMKCDLVTFLARADNLSDSHMSFCLDSTTWYWPQGEQLESHPNLSGASGGPCFRLVVSSETIELAGFIYEASIEYEVIRVRQAAVIRPDGTIDEG